MVSGEAQVSRAPWLAETPPPHPRGLFPGLLLTVLLWSVDWEGECGAWHGSKLVLSVYSPKTLRFECLWMNIS
jgi:hypothetical protein